MKGIRRRSTKYTSLVRKERTSTQPQKRIEGYWGSRKVPVPDTIDPSIKNSFVNKLNEVEKNANKYSYKGWSECRVCKKHNGSCEFATNEWIWPSGYKHYIIDHNVKPSKPFYDYIMKYTSTSSRRRSKRRISKKRTSKRRASSQPRNRIEGYWGPKKVPIPDTIDPSIKNSFVNKLNNVEKNANVINYKGWSNCRVCKKENGSSEFKTDKWNWPEGYKHYIIDHNVKPSKPFYEYIMNK